MARISEWRRLFGPGSLTGTFTLTIGGTAIEGVESYQRQDGQKWIRFPDALHVRVIAALEDHLRTAA